MSGPGSISDAEQPFVDAVRAAAKAAITEVEGDGRVIDAFQLGWLMGDVINARSGPPFPVDVEMPESAGFKYQARRLTALVGSLKLDRIDPSNVVSQLAEGTEAKDVAAQWRPDLAAALRGADSRYAKAYGLGEQLNRLRNETFTTALFAQDWVAAMLVALDGLSTALPPHAARSVASSIRKWSTLETAPSNPETLLPAQCDLWRTLLAGEKKGTEMLEPQNYLDAAERLGQKLREMGFTVLKRFPALVAAIVVLFVGGILLLIVGSSAGTTAVAGISAVLAAFGLSWKAVGGALGKLAGKIEAPLWGGELDGAITDAITLAHPGAGSSPAAPPPGTRDYAGRATRALHAAGKRSGS
jgi:hypothetical protein